MCRLLAPVSLVGPLVSFAGPLVSLSNISAAFSLCDTRSHSPSCSRTAQPPQKTAPNAVLLKHHMRPCTDELCVILQKMGMLLLHPLLSSLQLPTLLAMCEEYRLGQLIETIQLWPCTITFPPSRNITGSLVTSIMFNGTCHNKLG
ncbi:hypothetical protein BJV77DRAFT_1034893 [Russula vinacea]|nr:hypothetical protein BJV77DRAFT_1034893 [Russula vinacea]